MLIGLLHGLRVLLALPLLAYVVLSVWGVNDVAQQDARWANWLATSDIPILQAGLPADGSLNGRFVIIQGQLGGAATIDPVTGAQLQAALVNRSVRQKSQSTSTSTSGGLTPRHRTFATTRVTWGFVSRERWPASLSGQTLQAPAQVTLGSWQLPVDVLYAPDRRQLGELIWLSEQDYFRPVTRKEAPFGRVAVAYTGIPHGTEVTAAGVVQDGTLLPGTEGFRKVLFAPTTLSAPGMAQFFRKHYATTPHQYGWLYSVVLWPVVILLLRPLAALPGLGQLAPLRRLLAMPRYGRWPLALLIAILLFMTLVLADRLLP